jgi:methyl-accepting chemotaxis protein
MDDTDSQSPVRRLAALVPGRIRSSYVAKTAVVFVLVVLVLGAVGGSMFLQTGAALRTDTNEQLTKSTSLQAESLGQWLGLMKEEARLLSRSAAVRSRDPETVTTYLSREVEQRSRLPAEVTAVHYFNRSVTVIEASTRPAFVGVNPREEGVSWAQESLSFDGADESVVTDPFTDPMNGDPMLAVISPVPDQSDRALVVMVNLAERIESLPRPDDGFTHVVDDAGTVVMSHRSDRMLQQNMGEQGVDSMAVERGLAGRTGTMRMTMGGEELLMAYTPVPETDWVLMSHVPTAAAFALQGTISRNLLVLILVSVLGLGIVGVAVWRNARALTTLSDTAERMAEGDLGVEVPDLRRTDELGQLFASFAAMRDRLRSLVEEVEAEREAAEDARREAEGLTEHLEATAEEYGAVMDACADGDLTRRLEPDDESEAMADIAVAFNDMIEEWAGTVGHVRQFADEVADESDSLSTSARELESASQEVTDSIQEISAGATEQSANLQEIADTMNDLSATIEEVASSADEVADTARDAAEAGEIGREAAGDAAAAMTEIEDRTGATVEEVETLQTEIEEIGEVVALIEEIAEQTNMLALNASIEAARAGEAGEGFAVVADEVKDLAEETKAATEEIEASIERVQATATTTVEDIGAVQESVAEGVDTVTAAIDALEDIADHVEDTDAGVQEIATATDEQAASTQEVVAMVDDVAAISTQTTETAEDVVAAGEQQTATTTEVSRSADDLSMKADQLTDLLGEFATDRTGPAPSADVTAGAAADGGRGPEGDGE